MADTYFNDIYFNGDHCDDIVIDGYYHDRAYMCDYFGDTKLVWEKTGLFFGKYTEQKFCNYQNRTYCIGKVFQNDDIGNQIIIDNCTLSEYDFSQGKWIVLAKNCADYYRYLYACPSGLVIQAAEKPLAILDFDGKKLSLSTNFIYNGADTPITTNDGNIYITTQNGMAGLALCEYGNPDKVISFTPTDGYSVNLVCVGNEMYGKAYKSEPTDKPTVSKYSRAYFKVVYNFSSKSISWEKLIEYSWNSGEPEPNTYPFLRGSFGAFYNGIYNKLYSARTIYVENVGHYIAEYFDPEAYGSTESYGDNKYIAAVNGNQKALITYGNTDNNGNRSITYISCFGIEFNFRDGQIIVHESYVGGQNIYATLKDDYLQIGRYKFNKDGTYEELSGEVIEK